MAEDTSVIFHSPSKPPSWHPVNSKFTKETIELICLKLAQGESLREITKSASMPNRSTILGWLFREGKEYDMFRNLYKIARAAQAESMFEEMLEIADDAQHFDGKDHAKVNAARLRVDTRKWALSKMKPGTYGDKVYTAPASATQVNVMVNAPKSESIKEWMEAQKAQGREVTVDAEAVEAREES